jgi:hypothetical protein
MVIGGTEPREAGSQRSNARTGGTAGAGDTPSMIRLRMRYSDLPPKGMLPESSTNLQTMREAEGQEASSAKDSTRAAREVEDAWKCGAH